jgi:hypothetical protein
MLDHVSFDLCYRFNPLHSILSPLRLIYAYLQHERYNLREIYLPNLAGCKKVLYIFQGLARIHLNELWEHLEDQGVHPSM